MRGEHDIGTEPALADALAEASAHSHVVVDLSDCTFIDSTVIASLIKHASALEERGERFALVIPPEQRHVSRIAQMVRLSEFLAVHDSRDAALASLG
jgi:anti-anti-sigma factor